MHGALYERTPVLSLAPDSIASLGELDAVSLSDLWGVFTKCKDSLQDGRRLENLSWRLWFDSGRRETEMYAEKSSLLSAPAGPTSRTPAEEAGWSDPEWSETTDSESEEDDEADQRVPSSSSRPNLRRSSTERTRTNPATPPTSTLGDEHPPSRPTITTATRGSTGGGLFDRCPSKCTITGGSLQRMITGLTTLPAITPAPKARSAVDVSPPSELPTPNIESRGSSAPATAPALPPPTVVAPTPPSSTTTRPQPTVTSPLPTAMVRSSSSGAGAAILAKSLSLKRSASKTTSASPRPESRQRLSGGNNGSSSAVAATAAPHTQPPRKADTVQQTLGSAVNLQRTASTASFEPKSLVKGFDTTAFENRPQQGSIAPPPTPAPAPSAALAPSPPSTLKSAFKKPGASKKIFFISSHSDSEDDLSSSNSTGRRASTSRVPYGRSNLSPPDRVPAPPSPSPASQPPNSTAAKASGGAARQEAEAEDEWDDEDSEEDDDDDDDASSGWGSEYSTESDAPPTRKSGAKNPDLFAKRPTAPATEGQLKPRGPGLLSQLFHPDLFIDESDRRHSTADMSRHKSLPALHTSKSAGVLTEQLRNKSFLKGAPEGTEMESSSDEDSSDEYEDEDEEDSPPPTAVAAALRRIEAAGPIAPPQTPRTTRRAMLATELSESLRRNLLWERQTRNRVMGGPPNRFAQPVANPSAAANQQRPSTAMGTTTTQAPAGGALVPPKAPHQFEGLRAPHPSPATRDSSPVQPNNMVRRHTTGHGLYLAAQTGALANGRSPDSDYSDGGTRQDAYGGAFGHGLHDHGW